MKRIRIKSERETAVHFESSIDSSYTLCGLDNCGDYDLGIEVLGVTNRKCDCQDCIKIVTQCKSIKSTEYKH